MSLGDAFLGKVLLLFVAALVTGFALPLILKQVEERKARAHKRFEADLARQARVIDAQVQLLENLSQLLWSFQLAAIEVSYYSGASDRTLYEKALHKYDESTGDLLGRIRAEVSKSLRLTSVPTYNALKELYYDGLLELDKRLRGLIEGRKRDWHEFNRYAVYEFSERVDNVLNNLAEELRLNGAAARGPEMQVLPAPGV